MKTVTYRDEKWYRATTNYHGIVGKTQYFVSTKPRTQRWKDDNYYTYFIIHRFTPFIVFGAFWLIVCIIGFILSCLGKVLVLLLAGQVKLIFDKDTYTQGFNGDDSPLLDAIKDIREAFSNKSWSQWYEVRSKQKLTYEELRKAIRENKDWEHTIIEVKKYTNWGTKYD